MAFWDLFKINWLEIGPILLGHELKQLNSEQAVFLTEYENIKRNIKN